MPTSVRLDAKTEGLVNRLVRQSGRTKSEVIRDAIRLLAETQARQGRAGPLYQRIAHLIGVADSGGAKLSERTGERFRQLLLERARERGSR
ncbi:MAG TPA: ribbon-helix-helix protein, CopG family [Methylomirabilota bacterium]|jgi:Arc/MetJ-type ribon-helix-helix transcriptional regulator|nr:ribbon-helix-helix protein, CopG family [Methylomirabilota bacterium]